MYRDKENHRGSLVGRLGSYRTSTGNRIQAMLGVPQMRTVTFTMSDPDVLDVTRVLKVTKAGTQTVKTYADTGVEVKLEDLVLEDVPRDIPIELVKYSMVILGTGLDSERAKVVWVDERHLTHL